MDEAEELARDAGGGGGRGRGVPGGVEARVLARGQGARAAAAAGARLLEDLLVAAAVACGGRSGGGGRGAQARGAARVLVGEEPVAQELVVHEALHDRVHVARVAEVLEPAHGQRLHVGARRNRALLRQSRQCRPPLMQKSC